MVIKILITIFVAFAISRAFLRYRDKSFGMFALFFWSIVWGIIVFFVWLPRASDIIARVIGVGRGVEALLLISVVALFYGLFRTYVKLEFIEHEITTLVRNIALKERKDS
jgi:small membrane protein